MNPIPEVISCQVVEPTGVRLEFRDGWNGILDLGPPLHGPILGQLKQPAKFRQVRVQDGTLAWSNGADICPNVLRYWCELGRVCSQRQLDAHFTAMDSAPARIAETQGQYRAKPR